MTISYRDKQAATTAPSHQSSNIVEATVQGTETKRENIPVEQHEDVAEKVLVEEQEQEQDSQEWYVQNLQELEKVETEMIKKLSKGKGDDAHAELPQPSKYM